MSNTLHRPYHCIKMTLTLYMAPASPPVRAVLLCAAYLGITLDLKEINVMGGEQLKPEYLKVNKCIIFKL